MSRDLAETQLFCYREGLVGEAFAKADPTEVSSDEDAHLAHVAGPGGLVEVNGGITGDLTVASFRQDGNSAAAANVLHPVLDRLRPRDIGA